MFVRNTEKFVYLYELFSIMGAVKSLHAVLTGDLVNSTQLKPATEKALLKELSRMLKPYLFEFYRGDSLQVYVKDPVQSLKIALLCRTLAISRTAGEGDLPLSDIRISIGIGSVILPVKTPGTARGEAFLLSGRLFDDLQKTDRRLAIGADDLFADAGLQVMADYLDSIYKGMTVKQADAILGLLMGKSQQQVALELDKSKSTVSQLVSSGRWSEIERILQQFEWLINQLYEHRIHLAD
jgi:hypothetical protein